MDNFLALGTHQEDCLFRMDAHFCCTCKKPYPLLLDIPLKAGESVNFLTSPIKLAEDLSPKMPVLWEVEESDG